MHQRFTPYGTLLARDSAGSSMPKGLHVGWTGREYDAETGFTFHRARYYSADLRRWTQEDPIGYAGGGNLYAYVGGAVMEARDPSGLMEDLSGRGLGFAEASRPNENYQLPPWPGGGRRRGGLLNTSYIEDDGYLDALMDALQARTYCRAGTCPGGLSEKQFDAVVNSLAQMGTNLRSHVGWLLKAGRIHSAKLDDPLAFAVVRVDSPGDIFVNSDAYEKVESGGVTWLSRVGDIFSVGAARLAFTLAHEVGHMVQIAAYGPAYARAMSSSGDRLERQADQFACAHLTQSVIFGECR